MADDHLAVGCLNVLDDEEIVSALGQEWHTECFRCSACDAALSNWYFEKDGLLFCKEDYWARYGESCQQCSQIITGPVMVAGDHKFHPECFCCGLCFAFIGDGDSYALVERSKLYCGQCYKRQMNPLHKTSKCPFAKKPHSIRLVEIPGGQKGIKLSADPIGSTAHCLTISQIIWKFHGKLSRLLLTVLTSTLNFCCQFAPYRLDVNNDLVSLHLGDRILEINGSPVKDTCLENVENLIRYSDTVLQLTIEHDPEVISRKWPSFPTISIQQPPLTTTRSETNIPSKKPSSPESLPFWRYGSNNSIPDFIEAKSGSFKNDVDEHTNDKFGYDKFTNDKFKYDKITRDKITNDNITNDKFTNDKITKDKITKDKITKDKITNDKIGNDKIGNDKFIYGKFTYDKITNDRITRDKITSDKITSNKITSHKIISDKITSDKITNDTITSDKITNDKVKNDKIKNDKVKNDKTKTDKERLFKRKDEGYMSGTRSRQLLRRKNNLCLNESRGQSLDKERSSSMSRLLDDQANNSKKCSELSRAYSFLESRPPQRVFRASDLVKGELLGKGFFGQVFKVTTRDTAEVMVLKELYRVDEEAQKNFLKEVAVLRSLHHHNVLRFIGVLYKERRLHLVTEFIAGGSLTQLLHDTNQPLPWEQRVSFAKDIAAGMSYLHSMNIIHRDLNSHNCLVREDKTVVVADFGLARIVTHNSNSVRRSQIGGKRHERKKRYTVVGNPYWMAPEMMKGNKYDEKVDIFSFGIVLCEIIGRVQADPDFLPRSNDFGLDHNVFREKFCFSCPEPFYLITFLCTDLNPDKRPPFEVTEVWLESLLMHLSVGVKLPTDLLFDIQHFRGLSPSSSGSTTPEGLGPGTQKKSGKNLEPITEGKPTLKEYPNYENIDFLKNDSAFVVEPEKAIKTVKKIEGYRERKLFDSTLENNLKDSGKITLPLRKIPKNFTKNKLSASAVPVKEPHSKLSNLSLQNLKSSTLPSRVTQKYVLNLKNNGIPDVVSKRFENKGTVKHLQQNAVKHLQQNTAKNLPKVPLVLNVETLPAPGSSTKSSLVKTIIENLNRKDKMSCQEPSKVSGFDNRGFFERGSLKITGTPKEKITGKNFQPAEEFTVL